MSGGWDAEAHVRLLREQKGASSLYTADLIEYQHHKIQILQAQLKEAMRILERRIPHERT